MAHLASRLVTERIVSDWDDSRGSTSIAASHEACHEVIVGASRSFTMASAFLPKWARQPTWALYAMFRTLDDLVDSR